MNLNPFSFVKNLLQGRRGLATRRPTPDASGSIDSPANGSSTASGCGPDGAPGNLTLELPLAAILQMLPSHLQGRLRYSQVGSRTISVPLDRIVPQLAHGDVRISFGELRQAADYLFTHGAEDDATPVQLPLAEIVRRIDPALLLAPAQAPSPGAGLSRPIPRKEEPRLSLAAANGERTGVRDSSMAPAVASALPGRTAAPALNAVAVAEEAEPLNAPLAQSRLEWEAPRAATPVPPPQTLNSQRATLNAASAPLLIRLGVLAVSWPEAVRREIDQGHLAEAHVALPLELVAQGLKRGRLVFTWQTVRAWIEPAPAPAPSAHDDLELELALKIVAPLFLARQREANKPRARLEVGSEIPDLFVGLRQPALSSAECGAGSAKCKEGRGTGGAEGRNGDTHTGMVPEGPKAASAAPRPSAAAVAQSTTPQQLVNRAAQLQGVEGALVALRDGLLVASRFPAHLNADNIAAFLPQIFSKLGQYTQELHMGDLNALEFLVGKVPWKVFRLNGVFFVAFGREGEPLPSAPLASLVTELGQAQ